MKVLLITGTYPPEKCGIGDYTKQLEIYLKNEEVEVFILANINWSILNIIKIIKHIKLYNCNLIHIQYPSVGYNWSLIPQIISVFFKTIVTIHEVSQVFWLRKLSLIPFSFRSTLIFTSVYEKEYFYKLFFFARNENYVIPIGSNIPVGSNNKEKIKNEIVYFGLIRPEKGIEEVIDLAKVIQNGKFNFKVLIIGQVTEKFKTYYEEMVNRSLTLPVLWLINKNIDEVASLLSQRLYAYLPFPDGISERRGSALATITNQMITFTTKGDHTTLQLENTVLFVNNSSEVIEIILEDDTSQINQVIKNIAKYSKYIDWKNIAISHLNVYKIEVDPYLK